MSMDSVASQESASMTSDSSVVVGGESLEKPTSNGNAPQAVDSDRRFQRDLQAALEKSYYEM